MIDVIVWLFVLQIIGIIFLPLTVLWGKSLFKNGIYLSKLVGILFIALTSWVLTHFSFIPNQPFIYYLVFLLFALLNYILLKKHKHITRALKKNRNFIIIGELAFSLIFIGWTYIRGFNPNIDSFEKFMDFGFVNAIVNSPHMPPNDMWFSGNHINYYYFGHFINAMLIKLSQIKPDVGYNLMISTIVALSSQATFTLAASLPLKGKDSLKTTVKRGLLAALLVNFAGNLHTATFLFKKSLEPYWYMDSIRLIPETIHELPLYSYVVSDLHSHLSNIPWVLFSLLSLLVTINSIQKKGNNNLPLFPLIILGINLGINSIISLWDLPIYLGISTISLILVYLTKIKNKQHALRKILKAILIILATIVTTSGLFWINFQKVSYGVGFVIQRSQIIHLATLWGFPFAIFLIGIFLTYKQRKQSFYPKLLILWGLWALILILIPEIIYIKDIYGTRVNTVLKFYYQAFILFGIVSAYFITLIFSTKRLKIILIIPKIAIIIGIILTLLYPFQIVPAYYQKLKNFQGLSGLNFMQSGKLHWDKLAIDWINQNIKNTPVILEAAGISYTHDNRISTFTGIPTVQGWHVHEWLWRGGPEGPTKRTEDVKHIFETSSAVERDKLLNLYKVDYIYIGNLEKEKYPRINLSDLHLLGETVYQNQGVEIIKLNKQTILR